MVQEKATLGAMLDDFVLVAKHQYETLKIDYNQKPTPAKFAALEQLRKSLENLEKTQASPFKAELDARTVTLPVPAVTAPRTSVPKSSSPIWDAANRAEERSARMRRAAARAAARAGEDE